MAPSCARVHSHIHTTPFSPIYLQWLRRYRSLSCYLVDIMNHRDVTLTYSARTLELTAILPSSDHLWFLTNVWRNQIVMLGGDKLDRAFLVRINPRNTIADLKREIREEKPSFQQIDPSSLQLWKVSLYRWQESGHRSDPLTVTRVHGKSQRRLCSSY